MKKVKGILVVLMAAGCVAALAEKEACPQFGNDRGNKRDEEFRNKRESENRRGGPGEEQSHRPGGPGGPGGGGMIERFINNPEIAEKLDMSEEQVEQMHKIAERMRERQMELMEAMKNSGRRQAECMTAETVNQEEVMASIEESGRIQTEMAKLKARELLALQEILTPEQREKVRNMREKMQEHMRRKDDRGEEGDRERRGGEQFGDREKRGGEESGDRDREQMERKKEMMEKHKDQIMQRRKEWEQRRKEEEKRERDRRADEEKQIQL